MRTTLERELKLDVDRGFELPALPGEPIESRVFTSTYHDTPARSLGRAGITLRRRVENGKSLWQLKLPRSGRATTRAELEEAGGPAGPPEGIARLLIGHRRHGALEPVASLRTRRSGVRVRDVAEVTLDVVDVLDAGRSAGGFAEVEIELVGGGDADLERLGKKLRRAGARESSGEPKLMRVLELPVNGRPKRSAPLLDQLRHVLSEQLREIETRDPGVRLGEDPDDLHRFRVATRRTRALIRATRPLLGDALVPLGEELKRLAAVLGDVRDLDVLIAHLTARVAELDADEPAGRELLLALEAERDNARSRLLDALAAPSYDETLQAFDQAIALLPALEGDAARVARDAFRKLRRACDRLPRDPSDEALHALRIKAKRARYAAELAALGGGAAAAKAVDALKRVQDVIGTHQDAVVAEERLRKLARARTAVAAGRLIEGERARRRAMRAAFPAAVSDALALGRKAFG